MIQVNELLEIVAKLKKEGLTAAVVWLSFYKRLIQPIKSRVHPADEYWGPKDPSREQERKVPQREVVDRVWSFLVGPVSDKGAQKTFP
ncbi:hypothetical protein BAE44_0008364 [Dichanthelium oligosanthes]|uniref:Uncharacterized protein n=1 Tax=Dichanthelium oligosanthes TaxID=888268 RepID=A0A1E5VZQ7_9POAL|nr:hypothetical protein BAE44_0008364 [Dichanthelium oligosanthes]